MDDVRDLKDEVGRIRELMDAGRRGRPIGGELLAAFGAIVGFTALNQGATAFSLLPLELSVSPLAAAAAFLVAVIATTTPRSRTRGALAYVMLCLVAGLAGEAVWRGALGWIQSADQGVVPIWLPLLLLGAVAACFTVAALLGLVGLLRRSDALSPVNRAMIGVWSAVAVAVVVVTGICALSGLQTGYWFAFMLLPSLFWMLWGVGWAISGWVSNSRWMQLIALGSWLLAAWQAYSFSFYWTSAAGLLVLAMAPGLRLMHEARRPRGEP